eukprot:gene4669-3348_t
MAQLNREVHNLNVHRDYCRNRNPSDAIYEMLANGSTADSASLSEITHDIGTKKVSIKDCGPGILKEHFVMGKSRGEGHSNHGIGLKDAIVVLRREYQATITIRTRDYLYTFTDAKGSLGYETLHLVVDKVDLEIIQGTQIDIEYNAPSPDAVSKDVVKAKESFLELVKANLILAAAEEHLEMYIPTEGANSSKIFNFIFVSGVKKQTARQFRCVYNVKGCLADKVKSMVNRDHYIWKKKQFDKEIFPAIQQFAYETVASKPEYGYRMYPEETGYNNVVTSATCEFYRPSKPTTPPLRDVTASPRELASRDCRFLSSADDILECVCGSVNIDIVLTSAADIDHPRYREFQSGPDAVTYFTESIHGNAWVAEVVRAAKYWVMRCNDNEDLRVKSLAVELVVLEVFKACEEQCAYRSTKDNRKALFLAFLQFLTRPSDDQRIPHQQEKEDVFEEIKKPLWRYKRLAEAALQYPQ